jgi:cell division protein FtsL
LKGSQLLRRAHTVSVAMIGCIVLLAAGEVWLSHARYEVSRQMDQGLKQRQDLSANLSRLSLELASITRPDKLRSAAKRLGMAPPSPMQVIRP